MRDMLVRYTASENVYNIALAKLELGIYFETLFVKSISLLEFQVANDKSFELEARFIGFLSASEVAVHGSTYQIVLFKLLACKSS